jgi:hypothetical protein
MRAMSTDSRDTAIGLAIFAAIAIAFAWYAGADLSQLGGHGVAGSCVVLAFYLAPSIVAYWRRHPSAPAILLLDLLLGWTGLGWIIALIWANSAVRPKMGAR